MKTIKTTKTVNTAKAYEITEYCNTLLSPADEYFEKAPEAEVDKKGNLTFDFVLRIPSQPVPTDSPTITVPVCNIADVYDSADLYWNVASALILPDNLNVFLDLNWCKEVFGTTDSDIDEIRDTIKEVFPQIVQAFFNEAYLPDEEEGMKVFSN